MDKFLFLGMALLYVLDKSGLFSWISKRLHAWLPREKTMAVETLTGSLNRLMLYEDNTMKTIVGTFKIVDMGMVDVTHKTFYPFAPNSGIVKVYHEDE